MTPLEIGFAVATLALAIVLGLFGAWRWFVGRIDKIREAQHLEIDKRRKAIEELGKELHSRVNDIRDNFVRRDDLMTHMNHLEQGQRELKKAVESQSRRIDEALAALRPTAPKR